MLYLTRERGVCKGAEQGDTSLTHAACSELLMYDTAFCDRPSLEEAKIVDWRPKKALKNHPV